MTDIIRRFISATLTVILFIGITPGTIAEKIILNTNVSEDFESDSFGDFITSSNGVSVKEGALGNHYLSINPVVEGTNAFIKHEIKAENNVGYTVKFDFMQGGRKSDGVCVLSLQNKGKDIVEIETRDGNIIMKKRESTEIVTLVSDYSANRWYNFETELDFVAGFVYVKVNGNIKAEEEKLLANAKTMDMLYMGTNTSPGICVDNILIETKQDAATVSISGETVAVARAGKVSEYVYRAEAYDTNGMPITNFTMFTLLPADCGATLETDGTNRDKVTVKFDETAPATGNFTLTAECKGVSDSINITVSMYEPVVSDMKITGNTRISLRAKNEQYIVKAYDEHGAEVENPRCKFTLSPGNIGIPETLSVDENTGIVTVTGELPKDKYIYINAEYLDNPSDKKVIAQKRLVMLDSETYESDMIRLSELEDYVGTVNKLGKDVYNGTPLLADMYDRYAMTHSKWRSHNHGHVITSNLAFKGNYYRLLDDMYDITDDEKYRNQVDETYEYFLDNCVDERSGLPVWGGHAAINLETAEPYYVYGDEIHELKASTQYFGPFFRIDMDKSYDMIKNIMGSHITDWSTYAVTRHGSAGTLSENATWDGWDEFDLAALDTRYGKYYPVEVYDSLAFSSAASDFIAMCGEAYKNHTDPEVKAAAKGNGKNMLDTYFRVMNPETYVGGDSSTTTGFDGLKGLYQRYGEWWTDENFNKSAMTSAVNGDRYFNEYVEDIGEWLGVVEPMDYVAPGEPGYEEYVAYLDGLKDITYTNPETGQTSTLAQLINEAQMQFDDPLNAVNIAFLNFAQDIGGSEDEYGRYVTEQIVKKFANFIEIGYNFDRNKKSSAMLWDGTRLDGLSRGGEYRIRETFTTKKNGYRSKIGESYKESAPSSISLVACVMAYIYSADIEGIEKEREIIYKYIRNVFYHSGFGELGERYPGDNVKINTELEDSDSDGYQMIALVYLYQATGVQEYLDYARELGNNICKNMQVNGLFYYSTSLVNIPLGGWKTDRAANGLLMLEAAICGKFDELETYYPFTSYFDDKEYDYPELGTWPTENGWSQSTKLWVEVTYPNVWATDIILPENEITLSVGESKTLEITVLPDDASYSLCYDTTNRSCVNIDYDKNTLTGIAPGVAEITISNADKTAETVLKVTVK